MMPGRSIGRKRKTRKVSIWRRAAGKDKSQRAKSGRWLWFWFWVGLTREVDAVLMAWTTMVGRGEDVRL